MLTRVRATVGRTLGATIRATVVLAGVGTTIGWTFGATVRAAIVLTRVGSAVRDSFTLSQCKLLHRRGGQCPDGPAAEIVPAAAWPSTTLVTLRPTRQSGGLVSYPAVVPALRLSGTAAKLTMTFRIVAVQNTDGLASTGRQLDRRGGRKHETACWSANPAIPDFQPLTVAV